MKNVKDEKKNGEGKEDIYSLRDKMKKLQEAIEDYDTEPQMMLEVSKDGGHTFGTAKAAGLGHTGQYSHRVRWRNLGYNRKCVVRVSFSAPVDLVISSCEIRATATEAMI